MKKVRSFLMVGVLLTANNLLAQHQDKYTLTAGFNIFTPYTRGETNGPALVVSGTYPDLPASVFYSKYESRGLLGVSVGILFNDWRTAFTATWRMVDVNIPSWSQGSEIELSGRYLVWQHDQVSLSAILSATRCNFLNAARPWEGYFFEEEFWMPGIGLGVNFSVFHAEVKLHGWPRLIVAYVAESNGTASATPGQVWYIKTPIYLNYAISASVGLEFNLIGF